MAPGTYCENVVKESQKTVASVKLPTGVSKSCRLMGAAFLMYASMLSSVAVVRTALSASAAALPELFLGV
jgi:hypothetical protein